MVILQGVYLKNNPENKHVHNIIRTIQNTVKGETHIYSSEEHHALRCNALNKRGLSASFPACIIVCSFYRNCMLRHTRHCGLSLTGPHNNAVVTEISALYIVEIWQQDHSGTVFTESKKKRHLTEQNGCCDRRKHCFYHPGTTEIQIIWKPYLRVIITKDLPYYACTAKRKYEKTHLLPVYGPSLIVMTVQNSDRKSDLCTATFNFKYFLTWI